MFLGFVIPCVVKSGVRTRMKGPSRVSRKSPQRPSQAKVAKKTGRRDINRREGGAKLDPSQVNRAIATGRYTGVACTSKVAAAAKNNNRRGRIIHFSHHFQIYEHKLGREYVSPRINCVSYRFIIT